LLRLSEGEKGQFITTDEGRVVFIGGPSSGGGGSSSSQVIILGPGAQLDKEQLSHFDDQIEEQWQGQRGKAALFAMIGVKNGQGLILTKDDELKGVAGLTSYSNSLHLDNLATKESGYGKKMMQELAKEAVKRHTGLSWVSLPDAAGFYDAIGFASYGVGGFYDVGYKDLQKWLGSEK